MIKKEKKMGWKQKVSVFLEIDQESRDRKRRCNEIVDRAANVKKIQKKQAKGGK